MKIHLALALAILPQLLLVVETEAQDQTSPSAQAVPLARSFGGGLVCEALPGAADILHVPANLIIRGDQVQFGRPLFNWRRTRVLGSELGSGSIDEGGMVKLTSTWRFRNTSVRGAYAGKLTARGGTLTGTQSWTGPKGAPGSRTCQIALVPAAL